uniref:Uncharacterized protein n=1 Tax=Arundo donax TaxID=35708 RepID=A0A0A9GYC5_ARUDO
MILCQLLIKDMCFVQKSCLVDDFPYGDRPLFLNLPICGARKLNYFGRYHPKVA